MSGGESKVQCFKEQYWIGTWNVRSMNQGELEVVKQETARVNINLLGINELKYTGMSELNSDDHYTYHCGQESLRRNGVALRVNKSSKCSTWVQSQNNRMISVCFQGKPFSKQMGKNCKQWQFLFSWAPKSLWMVTAAMKLKDTCSLEEKLWQT